MREPPVEFDDHAVLLVHAVAPSPPPVPGRERHLAAGVGQAVRPLHIPVIAEFQHRLVAGDGRLENFVQVSAPAQPPALSHGRLQPDLVGKLPRDRPRHPPAYVIEAPGRLRQVKHRLLHRRPRRPGLTLHGVDHPIRSVHANAIDGRDVSFVRNGYVNGIDGPIDQPL
jgi:hypothetical protein